MHAYPERGMPKPSQQTSLRNPDLYFLVCKIIMGKQLHAVTLCEIILEHPLQIWLIQHKSTEFVICYFMVQGGLP